MAERRTTIVSQELAHMAADYFARTSNHESLITITHADLSDDLKTAMIYFTVLPEKMEESALAFAKRQRSEFRDYLKKHSRLPRIPHIDFLIDLGEKSRQRIDDLTRT